MAYTAADKLRSLVTARKAAAASRERTSRAAAEAVAQIAGRTAIESVFPAPANKLEHLLQRKQAGQLVGPHQREMERILALPLVPEMTEAEVRMFSSKHVLVSAQATGFTLFKTQAEGFDAYIETGGLLGPIAVGWGKTLLALMIGNYAFNHEGERRIMLLLPPEVLSQFESDLRQARLWVPFSTPVFIMGGKSKLKRRQIAASGKRGIYVLPYSLLSTKDTEENLADIRPGLIIADEAHKISRVSAARTKRMRRYFTKHPDVRCVALSGTITSKTLRDYWHLAKAACRNNNPLPNIKEMANEWGDKLDSAASTDGSPGPLRMLCRWAEKHWPDEDFPHTTTGFRRAFRRRLTSSPSVVSSGDAEISTSLIFRTRKLGMTDPTLIGLLDDVTEKWLTPNGDEIEFAMHAWKWQFELSAGFYNELYWPTVAKLMSRKGWLQPHAEDILQRSQDYFIAGQEYARTLRAFLLVGRAGLDTPMAVGSFMHIHGDKSYPRVPRYVFEAWRAMKELDFEDRIERDSRAVRVCDYKIEDAVEWAKQLPQGHGGIIWHYHKEIGEWLMERLHKSGRDILHCPAGANKEILDPANKNKVCVVSVSAHHTGKNLQHFHHQLMVQWPRPANMAEQMLGRTHRNGQKADELYVDMQHALDFDAANLAACINDALYIHQTTGNRQKLVYGNYTSPPRIYTPEALKALGLDPKILNAEQRKLMVETFGDFQ